MSQKHKILKFLKSGKRLTKLRALNELGVWNTGARILELRSQGYPIVTNMVERNEKRFAEYVLVK